MTDRTQQPPIRKPGPMAVRRPERVVWPNGVPLSVLHSGDNEVVRVDVLIEGGRWHQQYPLQALFAKALEELDDMSGAKVGDKTMMDAVIPASAAIAAYPGESEGELFTLAAQAAEEGAENSKNFGK